MADKIRDQLIGAWKLVSYVAKPVDGSSPFYPMGEEPMGIIRSLPVTCSTARPRSTAKKPPLIIAYSGPFHVDEEKKTLTHSMFVSLFPNWTGQTQPRVVEIDGDILHLSTASPIKSSGKTVMSYLQWSAGKQ
jgi:Lipocalin-like domain